MTTIDKLTKTPAPNTVYETVNKLIDAVNQGGGGGGGTATDVQINGTTITANNVANIMTNGTYNETNNKIATMSDVPNSVVELLKTIYPVGAIFIGTTATCPMFALFGTWELVAEDRCLQGSSTNHSANTTVAAGLPNIIGGMSALGTLMKGSGSPSSSDALSITKGTSTYAGYSQANGNSITGISFSAEDSNSIYGNSTTVQPPAYVVNVWRRTA